ncbi:phosphoribosylaminoimidazolesuccinocarboxamide synthase [Candidatus Neomarinimicrobiota bacterium]
MASSNIKPLPFKFLDENRDYSALITAGLDNCLTESNLPGGKKYDGKVRDTYLFDDKLVLITTDRQSAFDRVLAAIPFKGQALNMTSAWWFDKTRHIVQNHVLSIPDPNVTVAKKCDVFPIEFVVRGYITGSTSTSLWKNYADGSRNYCGNPLPDGLLKNQRLAAPITTPTTKDVEHDRPISPEEIVSEGWMTQADWDATNSIALELFAFGQQMAAEHGLILVDTKYEMGKDANGNITLIDEIHTPDSSRYWIASTYDEMMAAGKEPDNIDKEFLRLWFADNCDPYNDEILPPAPDELRVELSRRYILLYEMITGNPFPFEDASEEIGSRIRTSLEGVIS